MPPQPAPATTPSFSLSAEKGRAMLRRGVWIFVAVITIPMAAGMILAAGWEGALLATFAVLFFLVIMHPDRQTHRANQAAAGYSLAGFFMIFLMGKLWHFWFTGAILSAPWRTLHGSNGARMLSGVIALLAAMVCIPCSLMVFAPEFRLFGLCCLVLGPACCYLVNVFLINKEVQEWVAVLRRSKGLSADHWKVG